MFLTPFRNLEMTTVDLDDLEAAVRAAAHAYETGSQYVYKAPEWTSSAAEEEDFLQSAGAAVRAQDSVAAKLGLSDPLLDAKAMALRVDTALKARGVDLELRQRYFAAHEAYEFSQATYATRLARRKAEETAAMLRAQRQIAQDAANAQIQDDRTQIEALRARRELEHERGRGHVASASSSARNARDLQRARADQRRARDDSIRDRMRSLPVRYSSAGALALLVLSNLVADQPEHRHMFPFAEVNAVWDFFYMPVRDGFARSVGLDDEPASSGSRTRNRGLESLLQQDHPEGVHDKGLGRAAPTAFAPRNVGGPRQPTFFGL